MTPALDFHIRIKRKDFELDIKTQIFNGITGIYGPSGHGKTSLLNAITGIFKPDSGYIKIGNRTVFDANKKINTAVKNRKVGYVFQDLRLFPHLTIEKNLLYGKTQEREEVSFSDVVEILKIEDLLNKKPEQCSGGEKQRVAIGRAILSGSQILLMDEPFSALDVNLRREIIPFLNAVSRKFNLPIIIVSHDLPDLLSLTNQLILLKKGKVLAQGKFQDIIMDEANLEAMNESGWYSALHLYVFAMLESKNMALLKSNKSDLQIQVLTQTLNGHTRINQRLRVLIKPENIALAKEPVQNISLRNQIKGTIKKVFVKNGLAYCVVDVGDNIIAEVTEASQKNMKLGPGETVYCLFKSAALRVFLYSDA